jgi:hypothetical protein
MINILVGIVALFVICLILWGIGKIHWATEGTYASNVWNNIGHGFVVLVIFMFIAAIVYVLGMFLYGIGSWIIHLIW